MSRRGENIRKRKDGRWEARYKKGIGIDGKVVYGSVYAKTYREVKDKVRNMRFCLVPAGNSPMLFQDIAEQWIESNRIQLKGSTQLRYRYLLDTHLLPTLGPIPLDQLSESQINCFLAQKLVNGRLDGKGGLSPAYVRSMILVVCAVLRFAFAQGLYPTCTIGTTKPSYAKKEIKPLSHSEHLRLCSYCMEDSSGTGLGVLLSLFMGLRIGEVCALRWEDVDMENRLIHIRSTISRISVNGESKWIIGLPKTASSMRTIPISSKLFPLLSCMCRKEGFVIGGAEHFVNPRTYEYRFHRLLEKCGVSDVNYHTLRHTFATRCVEVGVDIKSLSEILGHSNVSITLNTYVHSSMEQKKHQLEKLTI